MWGVLPCISKDKDEALGGLSATLTLGLLQGCPSSRSNPRIALYDFSLSISISIGEWGLTLSDSSVSAWLRELRSPHRAFSASRFDIRVAGAANRVAQFANALRRELVVGEGVNLLTL